MTDRFFRLSAIILFLLTAVLTCSSCGNRTFDAARDGFFFDTTISIRLRETDKEKAEALLDECFRQCRKYELIFSAENPESELYRVNHRPENRVEISDDLRDCLEIAIRFSELTDGAFDFTIYPVSSLWDFHAEQPEIPSEDAVSEAVSKVDWRRVELTGNALVFDSSDTMIDLGAVAKGYISQKLKQYLSDSGCRSALINLGGNVSVLGRKSKKDAWSVGIQKPFSDRGEVLSVIPAEDNCVISSGIYERYFEKDGVRYHHIIDPKTGYPSETDLMQVTVIGTDDASCDALATCALLVGKDRIREIMSLLYTEENAPSLLYVADDGILRDAEGNAV